MAQVTLTVEGQSVHAVHHAPPGSPKGAVVMIHGFNSDLRELGDWPERIAQGGYHVLAFDQRGFGGSAGPPARSEAKRVLAEIDACVAWLRRSVGNLPLAVLGHSLGGQYAIAAARMETPFRCVVAVHPVDALWDELNPVEKAAYALLGGIAMRRVAASKSAGQIPFKVHYSDLFQDKAAMERAKAIGYLRTKVDLGNYHSARYERGSEFATGVTIPALVVQSPHDRVVAPKHSRAVHDALAGAKVWLEHDGGHSCALDKDGPRIASAILGFLDQHMTPAAPGSVPR